MATFEDAATGWQIYRAANGNASRAQLNQALRGRNKEPISPRTYQHYAKLLRLGYTEYVSINRLDIRHANSSVFDVADRSRYPDREFHGQGRLVVPTDKGVQVFVGVLVRVSDGFATLRVQATESAYAASRARKYKKGVLVFAQVDIERAIEISEGVEEVPGQLDLLLVFRSLLETELFVATSQVSVSDSRLVVNLGQNPPLSQVLQVVQRSFDLYESSRGFVETALSASVPQAGPLPTPRIRRMEVSNPVELIVGGAVGVVLIVAHVIHKVANSVQAGADAMAAVDNLNKTKSQEERAIELHRLQVQSLQLDHLKSTVEIADLLGILPESGAGLEGISDLQLDEGLSEQLEALKNQAVEASSELAVTSTLELEFDTGEASNDALADEEQ